MKIRLKLALTLLPLAAAGAATMTILSKRAVESVLTAQVRDRALSLAMASSQRPSIAKAVTLDDEKTLLPQLQELTQAGAAYAAALDADGRVIAHTNVAQRGKIEIPPPLKGLLLKNAGRDVIEVGAPILGPVAKGEDVYSVMGIAPQIGTLVVGMPLSEALRTSANIERQIVLVVLAITSLMIVVAILFLNRTLNPLHDLLKATSTLATGRLGGTVPVRSQDEIGELAKGFNSMSSRLALITVSKDELEAKARELQRSNEELERFAYIASHDLQEPLRKISNFIELLQRRYKGRLDADADQFIGYVVEGAQRMRSLIQDLLAYSRAGKGENRRQSVDMRELVQIVLNDLSIAVRDAKAVIETGELPVLQGDRGRLEQVVENLIANALKFRSADRPLRIKISAVAQGSGWRFSIEDNGIGVPLQFREKIFVIFQRLHSRKEYPGTGIGLAICRRLVESFGGRIWVEDSDGPGARFVFTLPQEVRHAAAV